MQNRLFLIGNPQEVLKLISDRIKLEPIGDPSLQNAIEMARSSMKYVTTFTKTYSNPSDVAATSLHILHAKYLSFLVHSRPAIQGTFTTRLNRVFKIKYASLSWRLQQK